MGGCKSDCHDTFARTDQISFLETARVFIDANVSIFDEFLMNKVDEVYKFIMVTNKSDKSLISCQSSRCTQVLIKY